MATSNKSVAAKAQTIIKKLEAYKETARLNRYLVGNNSAPIGTIDLLIETLNENIESLIH